MSRALKGKVVFITGASSGIGESLAIEAASRGADLVLLARREEALLEVAKEVQARGVKVRTIVGDVTNSSVLDGAVTAAATEFGRLDYVIANAGFGVTAPFEKLKNDDYRRQFNVNIFGVLRTIRSALPLVKKRKGVIALMGSVSSYVSTPFDSPYSMSKAAVRALADTLYLEMKPEGVAVSLICPGFVESEIRFKDNQGAFRENAKDPIPSWLIMSREKAAREMWDGLIARRRQIVVTGHGKLAIWLRQHFPSLFFWLVAKIPVGELRSRVKAEG